MDDDARSGDVPLSRAQSTGERASELGFDWDDPWGPMAKVREELQELEEVIGEEGGAVRARCVAEVGDLLFSVVNLARHLDVDAATALEATIRKFERRFDRVQQLSAAGGKSVDELTIEELEQLWERAKREEGTGVDDQG